MKHGITQGITYQVKILTWITWRLLCKSDATVTNWCLGTEVRQARGFHDLVLKYDIDDDDDDASGGNGIASKRVYRFVQIKHRLCLDDGVKITISALRSVQKKNVYSLIYLFRSYLAMLGNYDKIKSEQIVELTVFTNLDVDNIDFLEPVVERDKLFDFEGKGKRYRVNLQTLYLLNGDIVHSLRQIKYNDLLIQDFLSKLVFAVNQPSESMMEGLITREMGKVFSVPQIFYNDLYKNMIEWFTIYDAGRAPYLTEERAMGYLLEAQNTLSKTKETEMHIPDASPLSDMLSLLQI